MADRHPALVALDNATPDNRAEVMWRLYYLPDIMPRRKWFVHFGRAWSHSKYHCLFRDQFARILDGASRKELNLMMTAEERAVLKAAPKMILVQRGCSQLNERGLSWTRAAGFAERFAALNAGIPGRVPLILTGYVNKNRAVYKNDLNAQEIISTSVRIVKRDIYKGASV